MDLIGRKLESKAKQFAKKLLDQVVKNEPQITEHLQRITSEVVGEMTGLNNKFKTEESLARKIFEISLKDVKRLIESEEYFTQEALDEIVETRTKNINDTLRYTIIFSSEEYIFGFKSSLQKLKQNDFTVLENKSWNAW